MEKLASSKRLFYIDSRVTSQSKQKTRELTKRNRCTNLITMKIIQTHTLFRFILIPAKAGICLSLILILTSQAFADTTFVSGAVSGEWTRDGNPYIVEDSIWVEAEDTLTILAGVEVRFPRDFLFQVFGGLTIEGTEEDSVFFSVIADWHEWKGIYLIKEDYEYKFNYLKIRSVDYGFKLAQRTMVSLKSCSIITWTMVLRTWPNLASGHRIYISKCHLENLVRTTAIHLRGANVTIDSSHIIGLGSTIYMDGGRLEIIDSDMQGGIHLYGTLTNYERVHFIDLVGPSDRIETSGSIVDCIVEPMLVTNVPYNNLIRGSQLLGNFQATFQYGTLQIVNSRITNGNGGNALNYPIRIDEFDKLIIDSCNFECVTWIGTELTDTVIIKNTIFGRDFSIYQGDRVNDHSFVNIDHCIFENGPVWLMGVSNLIFNNNDVIHYTERNNLYPEILMLNSSDRRLNYNIYNNIFAVDTDSAYTFRFAGVVLDELGRRVRITYNTSYGTVGDFNLRRIEDFDYQLDSTNAAADPLFYDLQNRDLRLKYGSQCIDTGDPNSPRDPDGTRADRGAIYMPHDPVYIDDPAGNIPRINSFAAWPNPTNSIINISIPYLLPNTSISIYDVSGRVLWKINPVQGQFMSSVDLSAFSSGSYRILVTSNGILTTQPVTLLK